MPDLTKITAENEQRKAIRDKATPGPWQMTKHTTFGQVETGQATLYGLERYWPDPSLIMKNADAEFIVHARTDTAPETIDALVAEIERLQQENFTLRGCHCEEARRHSGTVKWYCVMHGAREREG